MKVNFYWHSYRYLPYEQALAIRELHTLLGQQPVFKDKGLSIESANAWKAPAQRTTYFREAIGDDGSRVVPLQTILEASTRKKNLLPIPTLFDFDSTLYADDSTEFQHFSEEQSPRKQSTRYSAHGLHEYRGKFNPQIVRAIGNILGLQPGDWILDPFGGSGTSLLESLHAGWNAISIDINPLGVQIAEAKIAAMHLPLAELQTYVETVSQNIYERFKNISFNKAFSEDQIQSIGGENWQTYLPGFDYLYCWFTQSVLVQLAMILYEISQIPCEEAQLLLRIALSDILRDVSLQDSGDLRIRRRKSPPENAPAIHTYLVNLKNKIEAIVKVRQYLPTLTTEQYALSGDSRYCFSVLQSSPKVRKNIRFNGVITSPPYATALPYIDTQRLSLVLLGLITPEQIRATERSLTGNREITIQERLKLEMAIENNADGLPDECILLCQKLKASVDKKSDGFRRQNVPALLYKYLTDMALMFKNMHSLLENNAPVALVVGKNQTSLGGKPFVIDTPRLLALLATEYGYELQEIFELDTYQRYDVHQGNSIRAENLIILRKHDHAN